jgi:Skp family chaperone for outer membrane proteins
MHHLLVTALFVVLATTASAGDAGLTLAKRVSMEKVLLVEQYQKGLEKCRDEKRKTVREKCQAKRKAELDKEMDALQDNPQAYFFQKERQGKVAQAGKKD